jgi:hypothetical protein
MPPQRLDERGQTGDSSTRLSPIRRRNASARFGISVTKSVP